MENTSPVYKPTIPASATVDVEITIVQGSELYSSHIVIGGFRKSSYIVELELDNVKQKTSEGCKVGNGQHDWDQTFIFAANLSSRLNLKLYCKHSTVRSDHVIGESTLELFDISRHENVKVDLHDSAKPGENFVSGCITLRLTVAATVTFSAGPVPCLDLQSLYSISQMTKIVESLSGEELGKVSPAWRRFLTSLDTVAANAQKLSELHPAVKITLGGASFALQMVLAQIDRDEKIDNLISVLADSYGYVADTYSIEKIAFYKDTLMKLLTQTTECSYFIGDYQKVTQFAKRTFVNLISDADLMIKKFEDTFRDLKIELILGSSLQTAVVSFRILQKVENIEIFLYLQRLKPLTNVGWDSDRTCLSGTRDTVINGLIQWGSMSSIPGTTQSSQIYVLQGSPGCGKSSIAHSIAQAFDRQKRLGAAIFLDNCTDKAINSGKISSTIAFLLANYDQKIGERIADKIKTDISLATANIGRQFPDLILSATQDLALVGPICIVIDGLQESVPHAEQLKFLTAVTDYFKLLPPNFRLLLTSRPSKDIARLLPGCISQTICFDDEGVISNANQYISQSLHQLFSKKPKLTDKYTPEELHDQLIRRSMGMHFWISTAHQSLLSCSDGDECKILGYILSNEFPLSKEEAMDQLYYAILSRTPYPELVHAICQTLIQSPYPLPLLDPPPFCSASPEYKPISIIRSIMQGFGFIKGSGRNNIDIPLFSIHPSLEDFLTNSRRCHGTAFYVDRLSAVPSLADICLECMNRLLKHNICELDDIMALNEEIPDKENRLRQRIPVMLQYACRNWVPHLEELNNSKKGRIAAVLQRLETFLSIHFLHWIECMSLLGWIDIASASLERLALWFMVGPFSLYTTDYDWADGWLFLFILLDKKHDISVEDPQYILTVNGLQYIRAFAPIISKAAMQTYLSALPLMPSDSILFGKCFTLSPLGLNLKSSPHSRIIADPPVILSLRDQSDIGPRASSGNIIVQGLCNGGAAFLDARSGKEVGSRIISTQKFVAIAFSPDGQFIVTAAGDTGDMEIWNVQTRRHAKYLSHKFNSSNFYPPFLTYSMDGTKIMGLDDEESHPQYRKLVFIWDVETGKCVYHLKVVVTRHISRDGIVLSPDGSQIAITNETGIQLIDVNTGRPNGKPIVLHTGDNVREKYKYAWSPNGQLFAFQHHGGKIRLRSLSNRSSKDLRLGGDKNPQLYGLVFSPDSSMLAVVHANIRDIQSSKITKVSIWDTQRGILAGEKRIENIISMELITFSTDHGQEIFIYGLSYDGLGLILPIRIVPIDPETCMNSPPKFHPSQTPRTVEYYSYHISGAVNEFASQVDAGGWIFNKKGERQMLIPQWANYELSSSSEQSADGKTQYRILEVKDPERQSVALKYIISFEAGETTAVFKTIVSKVS